MRARLQRGGTEPSVTPLSLSRVSSFSLAQPGAGGTPLIWAAGRGDVAVAEILIAAGADVDLAKDVRRAAARSCRARALSLSRPSLSRPPPPRAPRRRAFRRTFAASFRRARRRARSLPPLRARA